MKTALGISTILLVLVACTSGPSVSREDALMSMTENVIIPAYESLAEETSALKVAVDGLCVDPTAGSLKTAQDSWRKAKDAWMLSRAVGFGPAMDRRTRSFVDWWPVEAERIETTLSTKESISSEYVKEFLSTTQRGLGAIEYLIFIDETDISELADASTLRCEYLIATADVAATEASRALSDWTVGPPGDDPYSDVFTGQASSSLLPLAAVSEAVRTSVFLLRSIVDMQLGSAMGMNDSEADPTAIRGGPGRNGVADIKNQILSMREVYTGAEGTAMEVYGIGSLVAGVSQEADQRMLASFEQALHAVDALQEPLDETIHSDRATAISAYEALKELQVALNTEVVSLLGISVGFADTDGDGG